MFIGRERELGTLNRLFETGRFQCPVIYGRRRVGKTALITKFTGCKPAIFFTAIESDAQMNLRNLSRAVSLYEHPDRDSALVPTFDTFQQAFEAIFALARDEQLIFVIDEYPYLAKAAPSVSSILQALIDREQENSKLFLILCGSSLSFMREQVLSEKSPLYGRRTAQIELKPFDFFDSRRFFPDRDPVEAAKIYGMVGGVPLYLLQFKGSGSLKELAASALLNPDAILYEEPSNLLLQEVTKAARYNAVIGAIADGCTQSSEIASATGSSSAEISYFLKELERIGVVIKELPVIKSGRRPLYRLSDNLFRFWFRFVQPFASTLERGMLGRAWKAIEDGMPAYMGQVFEDICSQWLWRRALEGDLPVEFDKIGRWWGNDRERKQEAEIDIVAVAGTHVVLTGECKWRNEEFPLKALEKLKRRTSLIGDAPSAEFYGFSKTRFSAACVESARKSAHLHLVTFKDMVDSCS